MVVLDACVILLAVTIAAWLRPWRAVPAAGPPWAWVLAWVAVPLLWGLDVYARLPIVQPMSAAPLLVLLCGWPLAVLALLPAAAIVAVGGDLGVAEVLHRLVWLGLVPATGVLALGAAIRRWLPNHLMVYILGRAYFAVFVACAFSACMAMRVHVAPAGIQLADLMIAGVLTAFGEALVTGMLVAAMVAFRPEWLATYSDRLYLPYPHGNPR